MKRKWSLKGFFSKKKIKETSNNKRIYYFFDWQYCQVSIFDYFKLEMQRCIISLTVITKIGSIFCFYLKTMAANFVYQKSYRLQACNFILKDTPTQLLQVSALQLY